MDYTTMGKNIAKIRNMNHMTQEQLAEKTDVSTVFISQIETAVRKPSLETMYRLSGALNTTIDTLIGNDNLQAKYDEIAKMLQNRSADELSFITGILREICLNIREGRIISGNKD